MEQEIKQVAETVLPHVDQLVSKLLEYLQSGMAVAQEQAPLFINEILKWGMFENFAWGIFCLFPTFIYCFGARYLHPKFKALDQSDRDFLTPIYGVGHVATIFLLALAISHSLNHFLTAFKVLIAPRLYLIEYLSHLVK